MSEAVHITCPHCHAINRLPHSRLTEGGRCGSCHETLFPGLPIDLGMANFNRHIGRSELPQVVDFWAPWCGPCKMMAPVFKQAAKEFATKVIFLKVNTEVEQQLAARFAIRSIPTIALFKGGQEVDRVAGAMSIDQLRAWLKQHG
ncbi:MAG: thioredoxin TrxC [Gammaproteobacteria bacterium]|nr:thioredoxin TrxC [Gammaproteobacteria bacterium]